MNLKNLNSIVAIVTQLSLCAMGAWHPEILRFLLLSGIGSPTVTLNITKNFSTFLGISYIYQKYSQQKNCKQLACIPILGTM